ncbi:MAG: hypothetical protein U9N82_08340 [Thermodesulfobacteriota bacterium]|nr:hypothetical protein [Thermodesulfobacteriota bacterium]
MDWDDEYDSGHDNIDYASQQDGSMHYGKMFHRIAFNPFKMV